MAGVDNAQGEARKAASTAPQVRHRPRQSSSIARKIRHAAHPNPARSSGDSCKIVSELSFVRSLNCEVPPLVLHQLLSAMSRRMGDGEMPEAGTNRRCFVDPCDAGWLMARRRLARWRRADGSLARDRSARLTVTARCSAIGKDRVQARLNLATTSPRPADFLVMLGIKCSRTRVRFHGYPRSENRGSANLLLHAQRSGERYNVEIRLLGRVSDFTFARRYCDSGSSSRGS